MGHKHQTLNLEMPMEVYENEVLCGLIVMIAPDCRVRASKISCHNKGSFKVIEKKKGKNHNMFKLIKSL